MPRSMVSHSRYILTYSWPQAFRWFWEWLAYLSSSSSTECLHNEGPKLDDAWNRNGTCLDKEICNRECRYPSLITVFQYLKAQVVVSKNFVLYLVKGLKPQPLDYPIHVGKEQFVYPD